MDKVRDIWNLMRGSNLLFVAILLWVMEKWVAVPVLRTLYLSEQMSNGQLALLILATIGIAAGGYVINDYFDVKIDRINRPDRLIVTQSVSKQEAMYLSLTLSSIGIISGLALAGWLRSWIMGVVMVLVPGLLWFYSSSYKRQLLIGNLIVSLSAALTPLLVALGTVEAFRHTYGNEVLQLTPLSHRMWCWLGGFALFAFLCTWIREIIKDMQDQAGDRELECHTLPVVLGEGWTKIIVTLLLLLTAGLILFCWAQLLPFSTEWGGLNTRYMVFGMMVPIACELILLWAARIPSDYRTAQMLMKFIMFLGMLYAFVINKLL